jgi:hemerythrin-like domain-containing protein
MVAPSDTKPLADTRVYAVVHQAFRLVTTRLVDATGKLEPLALHGVIGPRWRFYAAVLHHHHHIEDDVIFPALIAARPGMGELIKHLELDHQELISKMDAAESAVAAFEEQPDSAHLERTHDALVAVRDMFFPHLDIEDAQIIPAIAEAIPPKEWDKMDEDALKSVPKEQLPLAVGALDEIMRGMPDAERPPPPPLPVRLMLAVSWRKRWSKWIEPLAV